jgi:molecular chaperone DnaJ
VSDFYQVLGVGRGASSDEIKRAYRRLARQYHPDVNGNDPEAAERFKEISKAYSVLADPEKRQRYDTFGDAGVDGYPAGPGDPFSVSFDDLLGAFFGSTDPFASRPRTRSRARRGDSIGMRLRVEFTEAVFGTSKDVRVRAAVACDRCGGSGAKPGTEPTVCRACSGSGQQRTVRQSLLGQLVTATTCSVCDGSGREVLSPCQQCRGQGLVMQDSTLSIDIPAGLDDGSQIRYPGRGHAGQYGGPPGDLIVELAVDQHPLFRRDGDNLHCTVRVPMTVAALGGSVPLTTLEGTELLPIEPGTQAGTVKRFRKRGVPHPEGRGRGDLLVELAVETPSQLSEPQRVLLRQLAQLRGEEPDDAAAHGSLFARLKGGGH